jgi:hypothetical protein
MAVLTLTPEPTNVAGGAVAGAALHLRRRGEQEVRTIPLAADKFTIGSSPRCHVCLPASEAQPLQCLLTLEAGAAMVTRWAAGVLLNGRDFTKSPLKSGDRLAIGDWEIGLNGFGAEPAPASTDVSRQRRKGDAKPPLDKKLRVEKQAAKVAKKQLAAEPAPAKEPAAFDERQLRAREFADRVVFDLWSANRAARERAKRLASALRQARRDMTLAAESFAKRQAELEAALVAATAERETTTAPPASSVENAKRQAALEAAELECNSLRVRLEAHAAAIEELRAQLAAAEAAQQLAEDKSISQIRLAEENATQLARLKAEVETQLVRESTGREEALVERQRLMAEREQLVAERDRLTAEHDRLAAERDALVIECDGLRELLEVAAMPVEPVDKIASFGEAPPAAVESDVERAAAPIVEQAPPTTAESDPPPVSFIEKYRHLLEDEGDDRADNGQRPSTLLDDEFLAPAKAPTCPAPDDESDEALEAYMSSMMQRVRGTTSPVEPGIAWTDVIQPEATEPKASALLAEGEFTPMKHATRKAPATSDLATMREIANASARTAIADHHKRRHHESAFGKLLVAAAASSCSAYVMSSAPGVNTGWFWAGIFAGVVGVAAAIQVVNTERRVRAEKCLAAAGVAVAGESASGGDAPAH